MLIVGTRTGIWTFAGGNETSGHTEAGLAGLDVTSVVAREGVILAGTRDGIYRSDDEGASWRQQSAGLTVRLVRWMAFHPDISNRELAGVEPAGIFVSSTAGESWRSCDELAPMREEGGWFLPYSPEAGCVRGFAFLGQRGYAAVEVGGVLRSDDGGETWRLVGGSTGRAEFGPLEPGFVHPDVHSVEGHPSSADVVFAATGGGLFHSEDGGERWSALHGDSYCRAVWIDSDDVGHIVAGPATGVGKDGRVKESVDGGDSWNESTEGLEMPWPTTMVERFVEIESELFAITSDGRLFARDRHEGPWSRRLSELEGINCITSMW